MKLTAYQKEENRLRRMFERHFKKYRGHDFQWDEEHGYINVITQAMFLGFHIGYSKGARK